MEMLLTVEQAAQRLQIGPEAIRVRLRRGLLRGVKSGKLWRVPESALLESAPKGEQDEWEIAAQRLSGLYEASVAQGGELTAFAQADGEVYDYPEATGAH